MGTEALVAGKRIKTQQKCTHTHIMCAYYESGLSTSHTNFICANYEPGFEHISYKYHLS